MVEARAAVARAAVERAAVMVEARAVGRAVAVRAVERAVAVRAVGAKVVVKAVGAKVVVKGMLPRHCGARGYTGASRAMHCPRRCTLPNAWRSGRS